MTESIALDISLAVVADGECNARIKQIQVSPALLTLHRALQLKDVGRGGFFWSDL